MTSEGNSKKLFFFNLGGDTRKVTYSENDLASFTDLDQMAKSKFSDESFSASGLEFWTTDKTHGVRYKLESLEDIYEGAVVEVINKDEGNKRKRKDSHEQEPKRARLGPRHVLRLRGLPWECTLEKLNEFFEGVKLLESQIIYRPDGRASGEGIVEVESPEDFEKALEKNNEHIGTRYIEVFKSTAEDMDRVMGRCNSGESIGGVENERNSVIRMRGLPFSALESDVIEFFDQVSIKPACVHIIREDGTGRPSGNAFVEFREKEDSITAMKCNRKNMGSRYIELFKSTMHDLKVSLGCVPSCDTLYNQGMTGGHTSNGSFGNFNGGHFGGSRADDTNCVKMRGLPFNCHEEDVTNFFQECGVTPVRIHRKPDGGEAYVEFLNGNDAQRAMGQNRAHIGHRYIELFKVSYDEVAQVVGLHDSNPIQKFRQF